MKHFLLFLLVTAALLLGSSTSKAQLAAPTNVTATPSTINAGYSSNLSAISTGNQIRWYTAATGGSPFATANSGANSTVHPYLTTTYYAETLQDGTTTLPLATTSATSITQNYGIVFDITTKSEPLTVVGFNRFSNIRDDSSCDVYYKQGTYVGYETDPSAWTHKWTYLSSNIDKQEWVTLDLYIPAYTTYSVMLYTNMPVTLYNQQTSTYSDSKITVTSGKMIGYGKFSTPVNAATMVGSVVYKYGPETTSATRTPVTVTVNNAPTDIALSPNSVNENVADNTTVGTLSTTDLNAGDSFTYSLTGNWADNNNFTISGNKLNIVSSPNFEVKGSYSVKVSTTDQTGLSFEKLLTVTINDVAEAPTVNTLAATNILKNAGTLNGTINANNLSTTVSFEYGLTNSYGSTVTADQSTVTGSSSTSVSKTINGLTPLTTYHYRVKGVNAAGTTYGADQTFTTSDIAPVITSTPGLTVPYDNLYSYTIEATTEGILETTLTVPTKPAWLSFKQGQSQAVQIGNIPAGTAISSVAGDNNGNMYAITTDGTTIYKIEANGTTTLWRSGLLSVTANELHISNGYIYIARNTNDQSITRVSLSEPSAAEENFCSEYYKVRSLTDRDGWIYYTLASTVQKISRVNETTKVKQLLLDGTHGLPWGPYGITFGNDGDLYIAELGINKIILKYDGTTLLTGTPGTPTTVLSGLPVDVTGIRQDKRGNFYVSTNGRGVRKYTSDFSSYQLVSSGTNDYVSYLSLTASDELVYSKLNSNEIYHMQNGSVLNGSPAKSDVGEHPVVIRAANSDGYSEQNFTIKVVDNVPPVITVKTPANSETNVALQPTLSLTFDEEVSLGDNGILSIYNGASLVKSYDLSVASDKALFTLSADKKNVSVTLTENLPVNTLVTVGISAGCVKDVHDNNFIGFTAASNTWKFTTINKSTQNITFPAITAKTYGDATFSLGNSTTDKGLTVTYTAADPSVVSIAGNQATILKAGTSTITATQAGDDQNFAATPVEQTLTVTKAELTVTADNQTKVYGSANPTLTFKYSGWLNGEEPIDTPPTTSTTISKTSEVDTYTDAITLTGGSDNNYTFKLVAGDFEVTKAELTVTADNKTKVYGSANPPLTFTYSGWVNGEEPIDTPPTASTTISKTSAVDTYADAITLTGGSDNNYTFRLVAGDFEVTKAELTVTADAKTKVYGDANPALTFQYSGWKNTDKEDYLDTKPTVSTTVNLLTNVGIHTNAITVSGGSDNNYTFSYVPANMEVTKATLTVAADAKTKVYGEANPALTFQYSGWKNTDKEDYLDTKPTVSTTVDLQTNVGIYTDAINVSGGSDNNYTFSYVQANMEVTKATLTVTADAKTKVYGDANPALTFQYSGWKNTDKEDYLDTKPTVSTTVNLLTNVGIHTNAITVSGGSDNNYTFSYVPANMEVTKVTLIVTANDKTKVYGDTNPELTFEYNGWINGDRESVLDTKPTASTKVNKTTDVGTYEITVAGGMDDIYSFSYVPANMNVTKAMLTVTADDKTKKYGEINPTLTFKYDGWVNDDKETNLDIKPTASTNVFKTTDVGDYVIKVAGGIDNNYEFTYIPATLKITKATLIVTADNKTKVYGESNPELTVQYSGWENGENETVLDTKPTVSTIVNETTSVGSYRITFSGGIDNNYAFLCFAGQFEVTVPKIAGDINGDGKITTPEFAGDTNGNGKIDETEIAGDINGDGKITVPELAGDTNGNSQIDGSELAGDTNGSGTIDNFEVTGDTNGNGKIEGNEVLGDTDGDGKNNVPKIAGDGNGNGKIDGSEIAGDINSDGTIALPELSGDINGNGKIDETEIAGDINGDGKITVPELAGDTNGNGKIDGSEIAGDINGDKIIALPELTGDINGNGKIDGSEVSGDANGNGKIDGNESIPTGINTTERKNALNAYSIGHTEIRLKGQVSEVAVARVYDMQGKLYVTKQLEAGDMNVILTPYLKTGIYLLWVKDQDQIQTLKLLVND